jgi:Secreted repeat of unknown function
MPLYYFARDATAGETAGQGVNDLWWVVAPDGSLIKSAPWPAAWRGPAPRPGSGSA